jgi:hypothetical protein
MATATQPPVQLPFTLHAADEQSILALACTHRKKEGTIYVTTCRLVFAWTHKTKSKTISIHTNRLTKYLFNKDDANDTHVKIVTLENSYVFDIKDKAALKQMRAGRSASIFWRQFGICNFAASILHLQTQRLFPELDAAQKAQKDRRTAGAAGLHAAQGDPKRAAVSAVVAGGGEGCSGLAPSLSSMEVGIEPAADALARRARLCGKPLSPKDRKVWLQAIALLMGLKIRNGYGAKDLTDEVGKSLHRATASRNCEDCGVKVTGAAAHSGGC